MLVALVMEFPSLLKIKSHIILIDVRMPVMTGIEATKEIQKMNIKAPIIVSTAYVENYDKKDAFAAGCNDYISNPINNNSLISIIPVYRNKRILERSKE